MTDQWICAQCQQTNPEGTRFCPNCGAANPALSPTVAPESDKVRPTVGNRRLLWAVAIGLWVVGCVVLAIAGGMWWGRRSAVDDNGSTVAQVMTSPVITSTPLPPTSPAEPTLTPTISPSPTSAATLVSNEADLHSDSDMLEIEPAGQEKIAFSFSNGKDFDIYIMNTDGSNSEHLTDSPTDDLYPIWSPDGQKIAFISEQDGRSEAYVINADGSNLTHLGEGKDPTWSPDSRQLAFVSEQNGKSEIYMIDVDGGNLMPLTEGNSPAWSPDGQKIAFETEGPNPQLYVINIDGSNPKHLIDNAADPVWSPNGDQIAFTSYYDAPPSKVYLVNADGSNLTRLADGAGPIWSPDGQRIAFRDISELADVRYETYVVINSDRTNQTTVISGLPQMRNIAPTWTADGQHLVLVSDRAGSDGTLGIDVINADGTGLNRLADRPGFYAFPAWSPKPSTPASPNDTATSTGDTLTVPSPATEDIPPEPIPPTPTPSPTRQPIVVAPTSTPVTAPTCNTPGVQITSPAPGTTFSQRNNYIVGTANIPRFHHWRIEYSTDPNGGWNFLMERDYPVDNDKLIMLDASTVPRGSYGLRLTVVDETGNYPEPCEVWYTNGF